MCLGIPGQIETVWNEGNSLVGQVSFGGVKKQINLTFVPEAKTGDFVLAHVGVAIAIIDEVQAKKSYDALDQALGEPAL